MADSARINRYKGLIFSFKPYALAFAKPARTSRDVLLHRRGWFVFVSESSNLDKTGIGECAPLPGLSTENNKDIEVGLALLSADPSAADSPDFVARYPSLKMAVETALQSLHAEPHWKLSEHWSEQSQLPINGLVWMDEKDAMREEALRKAEAGWPCIKLKIGGIRLQDELEIIRILRESYPPSKLEIRVDANGAFAPDEAPAILEKLARLDVHSIEQPIRKGQWREMGKLCALSPLPIALDEELIGVHGVDTREELLDCIRPHYLILKPGLLGGFASCDDWISRAQGRCGWWATSALESNAGLNAIAHWLLNKNVTMPQGLGTGALYQTNVHSFWVADRGILKASEQPVPANWFQLSGS